MIVSNTVVKNSEPISNETFETYRIQDRAKEIMKAIKLLVAHNYTVLDLEGNILRKDTMDKDPDSYHGARPRYDYKR